MCIAILQPANQRLTREEAKNSWESNSHGAGVAFIDGHIVKTEKILTSFADFWDMYERVCDQYGHNKMMVHFRIKTHGEANINNTHPFSVTDQIAMMHNGVIQKVTSKTSADRSDTRVFAEDYCRHLPEGWFGNPIIGALMEEFIGGSKLVFLRADGEHWIVNETKYGGHWGRDGFWFSNDSYKTKVYTNYQAWADIKGTETINGVKVDWKFNKQTGDVTIESGSYLTSRTVVHNIATPARMLKFAETHFEILDDIDLSMGGQLSEMITNYLDWKKQEIAA